MRVPLRISQHIERRVQIIKHSNDLHGALMVGMASAVVGKAHDAAEEESDGVVATRGDGATVAKLCGDADGEDRVEEPVKRISSGQFNLWCSIVFIFTAVGVTKCQRYS